RPRPEKVRPGRGRMPTRPRHSRLFTAAVAFQIRMERPAMTMKSSYTSGGTAFGRPATIFLTLALLSATFVPARAQQQTPLPASGKVNGKIALAAVAASGGSVTRNVYT